MKSNTDNESTGYFWTIKQIDSDDKTENSLTVIKNEYSDTAWRSADYRYPERNSSETVTHVTEESEMQEIVDAWSEEHSDVVADSDHPCGSEISREYFAGWHSSLETAE